MKKINFVLGIHNHQPVGNFDFVFEMAFKKAYMPFLEVFKKFENLKISVHNSGSLLEWLEKNRPEYLAVLSALVAEGRVEIISGGFYEPIFPFISDRDRAGQLKMLNEYVFKNFRYKPEGAWLTERIWEPYLAKSFALAGLKYTIVDDTHLKSTGLQERELTGYFVTEEDGYKLNVFPISSKMRYLVPFRMPGETIEYLRSLATEEGNNLVVLADDGEKFGIWPKTHEWVYGENWLEKFFTELEKNKEWINVATFSEYMAAHKPLSRIYMPTTSYDEMLEWCMPGETINEYEDFVKYLKNNGMYENVSRFVKGGYFKNFLNKYPESNNMQKKMAYVSNKVNKVFGEEDRVPEAVRLLYGGQCNCPYWHGVFGGLYLNHLRFANYSNLNRAEKIADENRFKSKTWLECEVLDIDKDGNEEVLLNSNIYNVYISPANGGHIFELDYKPRDFNMLDTLSRRKEAYHRDLFKENSGGGSGHQSVHEMTREFDSGLRQDLVYDRYRRVSFIDHFFGMDTGLEDFKTLRFKDGGNFIEKEYSHIEKISAQAITVNLERTGEVFNSKFKLLKTIKIKKDNPVLDFEYQLSNLGAAALEVRFGAEFNFSMLGGDSPDRFYYLPGRVLNDSRMISIGEEKDATVFGLIDKWLNIDINLSTENATPFDVWRFPIETISQSIGKLEKVYQSSAVLFSWRFSFQPGETKKICLKKKVLNVT